MKTEKQYKDIDNIKNELGSVINDFHKIDQRMIAIGLDYNQYFRKSISNKTIYSLRDNIIYRLNATKLHIEILTNLLDALDGELTSMYEQKDGGRNVHLHFSDRKTDISALFDSVIFHIISAFDYVSILVSYVCIHNDKKLKWTNLAKSSRDEKNPFSKLSAGKLINTLDREFIGRLYDHRSYLIHIGQENRSTGYSIDLLKGEVKAKIISSNQFNKNFSKLRNEEQDFSITYILFWLLNETTASILKIQFSIKEYMEQNKEIDRPLFYTKSSANENIPITKDIWDSKE